MQVEFISKIRIANKHGTGFIQIPKEKNNTLGLHENVAIYLNNETSFFAQTIKWGHIGIYVPKEITKSFLGKEVLVRLKKIDGYYAKVGYDGRIYLPLTLAKGFNLRHKNIVLIKIFQNDENIIQRYSEVNVRKRGKKIEYMCMIGKDLARRRIGFILEKKDSDYEKIENHVDLSDFLKTNFAKTSEENLIIFKRKIPIVINPRINLSNIALYLGSYYSDGTKVGNNWAISASTFEQAKYYMKIHNLLVKNSKLEFIISYTDTKDENKNTIINNLKRTWTKNVGNYPYKFRIRKPIGKNFAKCTKYGTLTIREHRIALLDFYNFLVKKLIQEIKITGDISLAIDFICGVLEGDGSVSAKKRGHIEIATNSREYMVISDVLSILEIKHKIVKAGENKYIIRVGALEILRNFGLLKDKIFMLYPKRRKALFERLQTVGAVKFLLGKGHKPASWVKAWFKENGFVDSEYKLTKKGIKLRNDLMKCMKSVTVK